MRQFGLIGYPLTHSFSKGYFARKFEQEGIADARYDIFPLESIAAFPALCAAHPDLAGLNVTIPYKEQVIPFLDALDPAAAEVGAVNTIRFEKGKMTGYNTDIFGFEQSLLPLLKPHHKQALILGTGGAAKAVEYVLKQLGIKVQYVSRSASEKAIAYADLDEVRMNQHPLVVNCSPVGMYPDVSACPPLPYHLMNSNYLLYDLIYNPEETLFLQQGWERGAQTKNGLEMLYLQAEKSWEIWNR